MINTLSVGKDNFYRQMLKLTIPIIIQNLLSAAVNSADVIMLNYVGQSAISAVSLAANYSNILFMVYYGLGTGASLLCAQYFGKNNMQAIHAIEGIALRFSIIISGIVALIAFTAPQLMMKIFTSDQELISIGSSYLRIMGITYLCWGITEVYLAILRSIGRVTISMALNMLAFILNIILNATFIFGLFGAPKLGATGVAIATAVSRLIELAACVIVSFLSKDVKLNLTFMFIRSKVLFGDFIRLSLPALGNDVSWSVAFSMYSVILGHLGTDAVAANSLVTVDLGAVGQKILFDLLMEKGYDIQSIHQDCGLLIFDGETQDTHSGGSGCGCSASVLAAHILPELAKGTWKRVLFVPTGALLSKTSFNEGDSIPGIAHAVVLEHCPV